MIWVNASPESVSVARAQIRTAGKSDVLDPKIPLIFGTSVSTTSMPSATHANFNSKLPDSYAILAADDGAARANLYQQREKGHVPGSHHRCRRKPSSLRGNHGWHEVAGRTRSAPARATYTGCVLSNTRRTHRGRSTSRPFRRGRRLMRLAMLCRLATVHTATRRMWPTEIDPLL